MPAKFKGKEKHLKTRKKPNFIQTHIHFWAMGYAFWRLCFICQDSFCPLVKGLDAEIIIFAVFTEENFQQCWQGL